MEDLQNVVEISKGVYWLGIRSDSRLEVNVYLRVFQGNKKTTSIIIDPGPLTCYDQILERLKSVLGDSPKVQIAFINHQDPDVGTNAIYFQKRNPNLTVITTEDTWRLIHFLGLKPQNFQAVDKFKDLRGRLSTGHIIQFVPTPFCHFRGACMLYDEESRVLFSGDLFGGLTFAPQLFATSENWEGMRIFHQIYMPSRDALRLAIDKIRRLEPAPKIIAPQHGVIIRENLIDEFLAKMYDLPAGMDLLKPTAIDKEIYLQAINGVLADIAQKLGQDIVDRTLKQFATDGSFPSLFKVREGKLIDVKEDNIIGSFKALIELLSKNQPQWTKEVIKETVLKSKWSLPLFEEEREEVATPEFLADGGEVQ